MVSNSDGRSRSSIAQLDFLDREEVTSNDSSSKLGIGTASKSFENNFPFINLVGCLAKQDKDVCLSACPPHREHHGRWVNCWIEK